MLLNESCCIPSRIILDAVSLSLLLVTSISSVDHFYHAIVFPIPYVLAMLTAGPTNRWPLTFPMVPLLVLQALRYVPSVEHRWSTVLIMSLSMLLIALAALLCVLFPPLKLPAIHGPYRVGVADLFLPVKAGDPCNSGGEDAIPSHVSVRLLYPTMDESNGGIPYLNPALAKVYCLQTMVFGAPSMLKKCGWFLHYWRLIRVPIRKNAALLTGDSTKLPVIIYSHGLGGSSEMYTYQTMSLASQGYLVLSINHSDGSAPAMMLHDGSVRLYDHNVAKLWSSQDYSTYVRRRRGQADYRAREFLAAVEAFLALDARDNVDLVKAGLSVRDRLDKSNVVFMGHSFGGATALVAATRRPNIVRGVVAHEPAVDWMTDDARKSLFSDSVMMDLTQKYTGGTGGYGKATKTDCKGSTNPHDLLVMYSKEWQDKNWGESKIVEELYRQGRLGRPKGTSNFQVVDDSHHMEFSDVAMLTPTWLARATGQVGKRSPFDTAADIERATIAWLARMRQHT
ncbi:hypothetical protein MPSEU_000258300 [Mayamaea pseudoterrestris]|nr:hypothetical protein MPSEU_000258300 [Mayamaea pseudoterrestris]